MKKNTFIAALILSLCLGLNLLQPARADNYGLDEAKSGSGNVFNESDIPTIIGQVVGAVLAFLGAVFFILMIYAGFKWMLARGNDSEAKNAMGLIKDAVIGLIIVIAAYAITKYVGGILTN